MEGDYIIVDVIGKLPEKGTDTGVGLLSSGTQISAHRLLFVGEYGRESLSSILFLSKCAAKIKEFLTIEWEPKINLR